MATEIEAARLLVHRAAWLKDQNKDYNTASAMAKLFAAETAMKTTVEAVQNPRWVRFCQGISRGAFDARCKDYTDLRRDK